MRGGRRRCARICVQAALRAPPPTLRTLRKLGPPSSRRRPWASASISAALKGRAARRRRCWTRPRPATTPEPVAVDAALGREDRLSASCLIVSVVPSAVTPSPISRAPVARNDAQRVGRARPHTGAARQAEPQRGLARDRAGRRAGRENVQQQRPVEAGLGDPVRPDAVNQVVAGFQRATGVADIAPRKQRGDPVGLMDDARAARSNALARPLVGPRAALSAGAAASTRAKPPASARSSYIRASPTHPAPAACPTSRPPPARRRPPPARSQGRAGCRRKTTGRRAGGAEVEADEQARYDEELGEFPAPVHEGRAIRPKQRSALQPTLSLRAKRSKPAIVPTS